MSQASLLYRGQKRRITRDEQDASTSQDALESPVDSLGDSTGGQSPRKILRRRRRISQLSTSSQQSVSSQASTSSQQSASFQASTSSKQSVPFQASTPSQQSASFQSAVGSVRQKPADSPQISRGMIYFADEELKEAIKKMVCFGISSTTEETDNTAEYVADQGAAIGPIDITHYTDFPMWNPEFDKLVP